MNKDSFFFSKSISLNEALYPDFKGLNIFYNRKYFANQWKPDLTREGLLILC